MLMEFSLVIMAKDCFLLCRKTEKFFSRLLRRGGEKGRGHPPQESVPFPFFR